MNRLQDKVTLITGAAHGAVTAQSVFATHAGRLPDGLALDAAGNVYVACYASDDLHRVTPAGNVGRFAQDPWAIKLSRPTNLAFREGHVYVANLGRQTITRARVDVVGQPLANVRR